MTAGGWIVMTMSVGGVVALFLWCLWKVITSPRETDHLHGAAGLETPDTIETSPEHPPNSSIRGVHQS
jgi:hypothetical protein